MKFLDIQLFNLHAVGEVARGQKISTRGDCLSIEKESYIQWARRLTDGRTKVFRGIDRYVSTVIEISERTMESRYFMHPAQPLDHDALAIRAVRTDELQKIAVALAEARRGIVSQRETYKDDNDVRQIIIDLTLRIDQHLEKLKKFLQVVNPVDDE